MKKPMKPMLTATEITSHERRTARLLSRARVDAARDEPVDDGRGPQQQDERRVPGRVEDVARDEQVHLLRASRTGTAGGAATSSTAKNTRKVSELKTTREPLVRCAYPASGREYTTGAHITPWGGPMNTREIALAALVASYHRFGLRKEGRGPPPPAEPATPAIDLAAEEAGHPQPLGRMDELRQREGHRIDRHGLRARRDHGLRRQPSAGHGRDPGRPERGPEGKPELGDPWTTTAVRGRGLRRPRRRDRQHHRRS